MSKTSLTAASSRTGVLFKVASSVSLSSALNNLAQVEERLSEQSNELNQESHSNPRDLYCTGCVLYPPNLPEQAYSESDWSMLQAMACSLDLLAGSSECQASRKTRCNLVDLSNSAPTSATSTGD
jgi:hypothetical protein